MANREDSTIGCSPFRYSRLVFLFAIGAHANEH
jgi:hypothetical protein